MFSAGIAIALREGMKKSRIVCVVFFCVISSAFAVDIPDAREVGMAPVTVETGGSLSAEWVRGCQAKVEKWKAAADKKLVSLGIVGALHASAEFGEETTYQRDNETNCYDSTTTLKCEASAKIVDPRFRLARFVRTKKLRFFADQDRECKELRAQVLALPESVAATYSIESDGALEFRVYCRVVSLAAVHF